MSAAILTRRSSAAALLALVVLHGAAAQEGSESGGALEDEPPTPPSPPPTPTPSPSPSPTGFWDGFWEPTGECPAQLASSCLSCGALAFEYVIAACALSCVLGALLGACCVDACCAEDDGYRSLDRQHHEGEAPAERGSRGGAAARPSLWLGAAVAAAGLVLLAAGVASDGEFEPVIDDADETAQLAGLAITVLGLLGVVYRLGQGQRPAAAPLAHAGDAESPEPLTPTKGNGGGPMRQPQLEPAPAPEPEPEPEVEPELESEEESAAGTGLGQELPPHSPSRSPRSPDMFGTPYAASV